MKIEVLKWLVDATEQLIGEIHEDWDDRDEIPLQRKLVETLIDLGAYLDRLIMTIVNSQQGKIDDELIQLSEETALRIEICLMDFETSEKL